MFRDEPMEATMAKEEGGARGAKKEIYLENVRLSYPYLFKPRVNENDDGKTTKKFQAKFILDKKKHKKLIGEIEDAMDDLIDAKWGKRPAKLTDDRLALRDGDDEDGEEFHGAMVLSSSNSKRPQVRDRNKEPLVEEDGKPYGGCYVNAIVRLWVQDNKFGKRINASLEAVQFYKDGEAFGAPPVDVDSKFKDFGEDDEDESPRKSRRSRDDDDEDEAPRKKKRSRDDDEDEDERPKKRRASRDDDEDEDERPSKKRRSRDDDEDEDERPRSRRRSRDDDED